MKLKNKPAQIRNCQVYRWSLNPDNYKTVFSWVLWRLFRFTKASSEFAFDFQPKIWRPKPEFSVDHRSTDWRRVLSSSRTNSNSTLHGPLGPSPKTKSAKQTSLRIVVSNIIWAQRFSRKEDNLNDSERTKNRRMLWIFFIFFVIFHCFH